MAGFCNSLSPLWAPECPVQVPQSEKVSGQHREYSAFGRRQPETGSIMYCGGEDGKRRNPRLYRASIAAGSPAVVTDNLSIAKADQSRSLKPTHICASGSYLKVKGSNPIPATKLPESFKSVSPPLVGFSLCYNAFLSVTL
jgi:hypothetical protein